ncbi:MAG: hypothetical protein AB7P69_25900 [Candidatus Binatia bacterium]
MHGGFRRFFIGLSVMALVLAGVGYAWTFTPSYSLYRIRQALLDHDYATFSYYVDVESVLDHAFAEVAGENQTEEKDAKPRGALAKLLKKGILKDFAREAREVVKAGAEIALEQMVRDQQRPLPEIPPFAVAAALWVGKSKGDSVSFPVKMKKGKQLEIRARQDSTGLWRVVEITNLSALLPALRRSHAKQEQRASE